MRMPTSRPRQGFTLIELMVASALSLIVLAAAMWSAAELQRRGTFEESLMEAQNTLRAVRELLVVELQRSGMGGGSARMYFGTLNGYQDVRFSIAVGTNESFDGKKVSFPKDTTFQGPPAAYKNATFDFTSDAIQIWSWDTKAVDKSVPPLPIGMLSLAQCPGATTSRRVGDELCLLTPPPAAGLEGRLILVVQPETNISCIMRVKSVKTDAADPRLVIVPGLTDGQAMTTGPCKSNPTGSDLAFWSDPKDIFAFLLRQVAFRINWKSNGTTQVPTLERREIASDMVPTVPEWVTLSENVETIKVQLAAQDTIYPAGPAESPLPWFPDATATPPRFAIDSCLIIPPASPPPACQAAIPVGKWPTYSPLSPTEAYEQLMGRVRMVRLQVVTRTARVDPALIDPNGTTFKKNVDDGYPKDGYKRRSSVLEIMPRNYSYSGSVPASGATP